MARLYYFRGARPNFGDELNPWLWPRLLPRFLDDASDELFLGIGTILNSGVPTAPRKIVFGSGYGYGEPPKLEPGKWRIHRLREPRTAQALGLPDTLAVGDPAILLRRMPWPRPTKQYPVSMRHWESIDCGHWPLACAQADVHADFVERWLTPVRAARGQHFRPQVSFLRIPGRTRIQVDFLARQEHLADDFARLGIDPPPLEQENPSAPPDTDFHAACSDRARVIGARVYRADLALTVCTF